MSPKHTTHVRIARYLETFGVDALHAPRKLDQLLCAQAMVTCTRQHSLATTSHDSGHPTQTRCLARIARSDAPRPLRLNIS
jgi:hypothetical protein